MTCRGRCYHRVLVEELTKCTARGPDDFLQKLRQVDGLLGVLFHGENLQVVVEAEHRTGLQVLDQRQKQVVNLL